MVNGVCMMWLYTNSSVAAMKSSTSVKSRGCSQNASVLYSASRNAFCEPMHMTTAFTRSVNVGSSGSS